MERIKDGVTVCSTPEYQIRGGDFPASTANFFFASWLLLHQHAKLSAYKPQRKVLFGTQQAHGILSPLSGSVSRKGGERTGEDDLHSDTLASPVHSQLRVRGVLAWDSTTVQSGLYIHSPRASASVYNNLKIMMSLGSSSLVEGFIVAPLTSSPIRADSTLGASA
jgi:hypothetical protein